MRRGGTALVLLLAACSPDGAIRRDAARLEGEFLGWWEADAAAGAGESRDPPARSRQERFTVASLHPSEGAALPRPREARGAGWEARDLGSIAHRRALLWIPAPAACRGASYLGVEPFAAWTELAIDPHCGAPGEPEDVAFTLHALHEITWPLLEVDAAGGVRALYGFDAGEGRYRRIDPTRPPRQERAR